MIPALAVFTNAHGGNVPVLVNGRSKQAGFLDALFGRLKSQRNELILLETLLTWVRSGFHGVSAAQQVSIHPKTLQYRLSRAAELAILDLANADVCFRLQLASSLFTLQEKQETSGASLHSRSAGLVFQWNALCQANQALSSGLLIEMINEVVL